GAGCVVVNLSSPEQNHHRVVGVDLARITPTDTTELLRALRHGDHPLYTLSVNSVLWPLSASLGITNLGLHIFHDTSVHQYLYPNTFVITRYVYPRVAATRMFLAVEQQYRERTSDAGVVFTDYEAAYVFDCFERLPDGRPEMSGIPVDPSGQRCRSR